MGLFTKINGVKFLSGTLTGYGDDYVTIDDNGEIKIPLDKISSIKLAVIF